MLTRRAIRERQFTRSPILFYPPDLYNGHMLFLPSPTFSVVPRLATWPSIVLWIAVELPFRRWQKITNARSLERLVLFRPPVGT